jgi:hypothetical protein
VRLARGQIRLWMVTANNLIYDPGNRCMRYALNAEEWVATRGNQASCGSSEK